MLNFETVTTSLFSGNMTDSQMDGMNALLNACSFYEVNDPNQVAYVLATAYHEVNKTMQPIAEYGKGKNRKYGKPVKIVKEK